MVKRVIAFETTHPSDDTSHTAAVASLKGLIATLPTLVEVENAGRRTERQATERRRAARADLHRMTRHLMRVSEIAERTDPTLKGTFVAPRHGIPNRTFIDLIRSLQAPLAAHREILLASGLGSAFEEELAAAITTFDDASQASDESRNAHIEGRGALNTLAQECREVVWVLDGLNAHRYHDEPERLDAWKAASNVYGPVARSADDADPSMPEVPRTDTEDGAGETERAEAA
jgi:hypothetical protein